jgi:hypothetical protein
MASLVIIVLVACTAGGLLGAYFKICAAICREDRRKWSLRRSATTRSAQSARDMCGIDAKWN